MGTWSPNDGVPPRTSPDTVKYFTSKNLFKRLRYLQFLKGASVATNENLEELAYITHELLERFGETM
jgi:hypothetical protein